MEGPITHERLMLKRKIRNVLSDTCTDFLYYDRKEDESLPVGGIEDAVIKETITVDEIVNAFRQRIDDAVAEERRKRNVVKI